MDETIKRPLSVLDRVVDALRRDVVRAGRAGQKLAPITKLSTRFGVSTNTIRSALTVLQHEGLVELKHGSGTFIRQPPALQKHVALLAELDLLHPSTSPFFRDMFRHLRNRLADQGLESRLYTGSTIPGSALPYSTLAGRQAVADIDRLSAVAAFAMLPDEPWITPVRQRGIPIVSNVPDLGSAVNADRKDLVRQAVRALAAQGRRAIGFLAWGTLAPLGPSSTRDEALAGIFAQAVKEAGLTTRPEWTCFAGSPSAQGAGWETFQDIWRASKARPDGLVIADDQLLPGVFQALQDWSVSVPGQLLLASHFTEGNPLLLPCPLIRVEYSPAAHARAMADLVVRALGGASTAIAPVLLPHRLALPPLSSYGTEAREAGTALRTVRRSREDGPILTENPTEDSQ